MNEGKFESFTPRGIEKEDIEASPPDVEGTAIVLQRHGEYERTEDNPRIGSLTPEGSEDVYASAETFFEKVFSGIPEEERKNVDILVLASDTQYQDGGRRSVETAERVIRAISETLEEFGLDQSQLLNGSGNISGDGGPRISERLREPQMFNDSPDFVEFLKREYGDRDKSFWIAFEEDAEKEARERMGAEGPDEIVDRTKREVDVLSRYSRAYHHKHPEKRLIIWAATHYDTISPYAKREILGEDKEYPLGVDYGAGIVMKIDPEGNKTVKIQGKAYEVSS